MTDTVLVTGGLGRSGRWLVDRLADDYAVHCVDLDHPGFEVTPTKEIDFSAADLTDAGEVFDLVTDVDPDAVVHWGAIPAPERHAGTRVFTNNVTGAYNVLDAAGRVGADVVQASSESAYGFPFAEELRLPERLPITESHPLEPEDPYGTGKVAAEEVGKMVARRDGIAVTSIRPSWIQYPGEYNCLDWAELEDGAGNFWSYVDVRDVAELVRRAVAEPPGGHEAVHAVAAENYLGRPTTEVIDDVFGAVPDDCSLATAERLFDFEPSHEWRTASEESVAAPSLVE
ncbi:MAG: NAD-dependent epimerase/dehydratase family protein [Halobaculum sp.]